MHQSWFFRRTCTDGYRARSLAARAPRRARGRAAIAWLASVPLVLALSACSESTQIHTRPAEAFVYVNGRMLGKSPVELSVRSWSVRRHAYHLRVEKAGYVSKETYLEPHFSVGRLISAVASSCFTCFHGFFEFDEDTEIVLDAEPPPPVFDPVVDRLTRLQSLYDQGLISAEELHEARAAILRGVPVEPGSVGGSPGGGD